MKISIVDKDGNLVKDISYATEYSAGFDIKAAEKVKFILDARGVSETVPVSTGLYLKVEGKVDGDVLPCLMILPRSGKSIEGLRIANAPGLVDLDYTGEIKILAHYAGARHKRVFMIEEGDKIAQGVFLNVMRPSSIPVNGRVRGDGGFGSTDNPESESSGDANSKPTSKGKIEVPPIKAKGAK